MMKNKISISVLFFLFVTLMYFACLLHLKGYAAPPGVGRVYYSFLVSLFFGCFFCGLIFIIASVVFFIKMIGSKKVGIGFWGSRPLSIYSREYLNEKGMQCRSLFMFLFFGFCGFFMGGLVSILALKALFF